MYQRLAEGATLAAAISNGLIRARARLRMDRDLTRWTSARRRQAPLGF